MSCLEREKLSVTELLLPFSVQRKLKEQEELALHEQRINESLKVLHQENMEDYARYDCVLSIIFLLWTKMYLWHRG